MSRRILSLLLLPCVLLSQAATFGHAHGGGEPVGHGLRPHFHASSAPHDHDHHCHASGGHHHHHDDGDEGHAPVSEPVTPSEHDSDAVYIAGVEAVVNSRHSAIDYELMVLLDGIVAEFCLPAALTAAPPQTAVRWAHAPPPDGHTCPRYLRLLTLLV